MFQHACVSRLIANDELYARPMDLFLMVEREAEDWPRTQYLLAVQVSMATDNPGYSYSGSRVYQQSSSVSNSSHICASSGDEMTSLRTVLDKEVKLFSVPPARVCRGLKSSVFLLDVTTTLHLYPLLIQDRRVCLLDIRMSGFPSTPACSSFGSYRKHFRPICFFSRSGWYLSWWYSLWWCCVASCQQRCGAVFGISA